MYFHGKLSPADKPDYERAAGWYMADTENPYCQFALAKMIEHGQGFTPNVETAEILYRKCLNANDYLTAESSYAIAQMQNNEQLPLTDMQKLYKTAAEIWLKDDHPESHIHLRLARMYEYGLGVPEDLSLAIDHYKAALKTPETEYKLGQLMQRIDGDATEIYAHYAAARVGMLYAEEHRPTSATAQQAVRLATMYRYGLVYGRGRTRQHLCTATLRSHGDAAYPSRAACSRIRRKATAATEPQLCCSPTQYDRQRFAPPNAARSTVCHCHNRPKAETYAAKA